MSPVSSEVIIRKISLIKKDFEKLVSLNVVDLVKYEESYDLQLITERLLERIIGRMISVNYYILRNNYDMIPTDYSQSFELMAQNKVLSSNLANELKGSAGLRNVLAHEYDQIDPKQVFASVNLIVRFVPEYLSEVVKVID